MPSIAQRLVGVDRSLLSNSRSIPKRNSLYLYEAAIERYTDASASIEETVSTSSVGLAPSKG